MHRLLRSKYIKLSPAERDLYWAKCASKKVHGLSDELKRDLDAWEEKEKHLIWEIKNEKSSNTTY